MAMKKFITLLFLIAMFTVGAWAQDPISGTPNQSCGSAREGISGCVSLPGAFGDLAQQAADAGFEVNLINAGNPLGALISEGVNGDINGNTGTSTAQDAGDNSPSGGLFNNALTFISTTFMNSFRAQVGAWHSNYHSNDSVMSITAVGEAWSPNPPTVAVGIVYPFGNDDPFLKVAKVAPYTPAEAPSFYAPETFGRSMGWTSWLRSAGREGFSVYQEALDGSGYWRTSDHWGQLPSGNWTFGTPDEMMQMGGQPYENGKFFVFDQPVSGFLRYGDATY
jgi:hypothetical protein